jgi:hypothetical protein
MREGNGETNGLLKLYVAPTIGNRIHINLYLGRICTWSSVCRITLKSAMFNECGCDDLFDYVSK